MVDNNIKDYVKVLLQDVVNKNHTVKEKKNIKIFSDRISIACVCCGDSEKVMSKKRGNLYLKTLWYKCFNCGESRSLFSLLKLFNEDIDFEKRIELADYVEDNVNKTKWSDEEFVGNNFDKLIPMETLSAYFNNVDNDPKITDFRPVTKGSKVYKYLIERKVFNHEDIYEGTYWHTNSWSEAVMININQAQGKVLGIQTRNLKSREKRFYKVISFSELYKWVYKTELDEIEKIGYDKLSYLYNILKVDWSRPVTIFEGFIDTKFFPNSIGCVGTNTDIHIILNQGANIRFFYDYDSTGIKKQKQMINKNLKVFLWEKFFEEWSKTSKNPFSAYLKLTANIVDLNDVAKVVENPYHKLNLENYFSIDMLDIMWIKDIPSTKINI